MGELMDAPNQQAVRADGSGPWEEGTGGETAEVAPTLDEMTKAQLLRYAADHELDVDETLTKGEIRAAIGDG
jgi:hypothetical protein